MTWGLVAFLICLVVLPTAAVGGIALTEFTAMRELPWGIRLLDTIRKLVNRTPGRARLLGHLALAGCTVMFVAVAVSAGVGLFATVVLHRPQPQGIALETAIGFAIMVPVQVLDTLGRHAYCTQVAQSPTFTAGGLFFATLLALWLVAYPLHWLFGW
jgi:hypothetical protein